MIGPVTVATDLCEPSVNVRPGQLWVWSFIINEGYWPFDIVTQQARDSFVFAGDIVMMHRGDSFIIVATDDPGPAQVPGQGQPRLDEFSYVVSWGTPNKRWHVAMKDNRLFWISHDLFNHAELMGDA